jgi:hypothetical protein
MQIHISKEVIYVGTKRSRNIIGKGVSNEFCAKQSNGRFFTPTLFKIDAGLEQYNRKFLSVQTSELLRLLWKLSFIL